MLKDKMIRRQNTENESELHEKNVKFSAPEEEKITLSDIKNKTSEVFRKLKSKVSTEKNIPKEDMEQNISLTYDELLEREEIEKMKTGVKKQKIKKIISKTKWYGLIIGAAYIIFLVFGAIVTQFEYDRNGNITPIKMSYSDIKNKDKYNDILKYYKELRKLYEKSLTYDYQLSIDSSVSLSLASKYNGLITDTDTIYVKVKGMSVDSSYEVLHNMMIAWMERYELYLKHMGTALSSNDNTSASQALQDREVVYQQFMNITKNIIAIGKSVKGVKTGTLEALSEWSPDKFISEELKKER